MSIPAVACIPSASNIMEAIRPHTHTPQKLIQYPTATYSVQTGRISFAPGTKFTRKLESRVSDRAQTTTMNIRPVQDGDKPRITRFRPPKATVPSLPNQSVTSMDYMDPRSALEYAKWSEIPPWFCRSKSDALVSDRFAEQIQSRFKTSVTDSTFIPDMPVDQEDGYSDDGIDVSSVISRQSSCTLPERLKASSQDVRPSNRSSHSISSRRSAYSLKPGSGRVFNPAIPHYKPLIGEVYSLRRFYPAHNPWRSLQLESEVNQYIEHKKKCQGRNVRFTDTVDVTTREPHVVDAARGPIQRPYIKRPSLDERTRQTRFSGEFGPNVSVEDISRHQGRMYDMHAQLKSMLQKS